MNVLVSGDKIEMKDKERHITIYVNVNWDKRLAFYPDSMAANVCVHVPDIKHELHWSYVVVNVDLPYKARKKGVVPFMEEIKSKIKMWIGV